MARKADLAPPMPVCDEYKPALEKQSRWSSEQWKPGQVPAGYTVIAGPHGVSRPWGEAHLEVKPPQARGNDPKLS
jgi:hypothetical protein